MEEGIYSFINFTVFTVQKYVYSFKNIICVQFDSLRIALHYLQAKKEVYFIISLWHFQGLCLNGLYHGGISKLYGILTGGELDY